jgi:hypothetical protein
MATRDAITEEERIVAELRSLGIRHLTQRAANPPARPRAPDALLADLVRQPSARVRAAAIALLLAHPEYSGALPAALDRLPPEERLNLQAFYLAALFLQEEHEDRLRALQPGRWLRLQAMPHVILDLDVPGGGTPRERLSALGREHRRLAGRAVNWAGTYEQVARKLLRQWEKEQA